ncbi:alpha/beta fold hydrolase [Nocardioides solisilvae]|uniref:alpha/beta fold hydrolase n=1 Tax=Nocardioides solisilvae TaxID=1542435 RepID=UPI0013A5934E|nr:alpha/beta hydrolase [Nocardioides solisilvae]
MTGPVELPVRRTGRPGGAPVLLLHGFTDSAQSWDLLLPHLAGAPGPGLDLSAVDLRGHGRAPRPDQGYAVADLAADVVAVLDQRPDGAAVVLVGHSLGSLVARRVALARPSRVAALVLVGALPATPNDSMTGLRDELHALGTPDDRVPEAWVRDFQEGTSSPDVPADFLEAAVAASHAVPARVWRAVADGFATADDAADLAGLTTPTLLLWGDRDPVSSEAEQRALAAALPRARLRVLDGLGHAPHWEDPARVARELLASLDGPDGD